MDGDEWAALASRRVVSRRVVSAATPLTSCASCPPTNLGPLGRRCWPRADDAEAIADDKSAAEEAEAEAEDEDEAAWIPSVVRSTALKRWRSSALCREA